MPATDTLARKRRRRERIIEVATEKDYILKGKRVNKNVYELQQIYETTQMLTPKVLPEFLERIRFMVVNEIRKASYSKSVDQNGEMFNFVLEKLLDKIIPKVDPITKQLTLKYKPEKANLGSYIMVTCYWSVREYQNTEKYYEGLVCCGDFMEDYSEVAEAPKIHDIKNLKFISSFDQNNIYVPLIQDILRGEALEN